MLRCGQDASGLYLGSVNGAEVRHRFLFQQPFNGADNLRITAGTQNAIHFRHLLRDFILIPLGKAAGNQDFADQSLLLELTHLQDIVDGFRLG